MIAPLKVELLSVLPPILYVPLVDWLAIIIVRANVNAPPISRVGLELFAVVEASPKVTAVLAFPKGPLVLTETLAPVINVPALIVVVPVKVFVPEIVNKLVPTFVRPNVPEELLTIPERVKSCPSALATVVPPMFRLNVTAVARLIAELIVRDEPYASSPEFVAVTVNGLLNVATLL